MYPQAYPGAKSLENTFLGTYKIGHTIGISSFCIKQTPAKI